MKQLKLITAIRRIASAASPSIRRNYPMSACGEMSAQRLISILLRPIQL
jgi:hypothetical protein